MFAGRGVRTEYIRPGQALEAVRQADDFDHARPLRPGDLGRIADAFHAQTAHVGIVNDHGVRLGQLGTQVGVQFVHPAHGVVAEVGANNHAQFPAAARLGPITETLEENLGALDFRLILQAGENAFADRLAEIDAQNLRRPHPNVGVRMVNRQRRNREQAEQQAALQGDQQRTKGDAPTRRADSATVRTTKSPANRTQRPPYEWRGARDRGVRSPIVNAAPFGPALALHP